MNKKWKWLLPGGQSQWTIVVLSMQIFIEGTQQTKKPNPSISLESVIFNTDYMLNMNQQIAVRPDCLKAINMSKTLFYATIQSHYAGP